MPSSIYFLYFQARFQAQQMQEKEEKLINLLEQRQEEAVRRIAYSNGRESTANSAHSGNSLSSNNSANSLTPSVGQRPGRVRQMFEERRKIQDTGNSPVGWDKSYPLKPVGMYKRNSNAGTSSNKLNKYSGGYGPQAIRQRSQSQNRGVSLDRNGRYPPSNSSGYSSSSIARTRSHHQLSNSSGEDSYGGSRPPSRGGGTVPPNYGTYGRPGAGLARSNTQGRFARRQAFEDEDQGHSYTREYVRNLPPTGGVTGAARKSRSNSLRDPSPSGRSSYDHSSYSSQSSDKSDPPAFSILPTSRSAHNIGAANGLGRRQGSNVGLRADSNLKVGSRSTSRSRINTRTFRYETQTILLLKVRP